MTMSKNTLSFMLVLTILPSMAMAGGESGGLSLLGQTARSASLGEAFTAVRDDIGGMYYNPASLATLKSGQASFSYQQGLIEDTQGNFQIGNSNGKSGYGLTVGYYDGGSIEIQNESGATNNVSAQRDITLALGLAHNFGGMSIGVTGKYLKSELIEQVSATAYAADLGLQVPMGSRLQLGASALNFGSGIKYESSEDKLPRLLNFGAGYLLLPGKNNTTLLLSSSRMMNEGINTLGAGLETIIGPLALRAGYKSGGGSNEFNLGAGFALGRSMLDYSFGMVNQFDAQHKVTLGLRFGGAAVPQIVRQPVQRPTVASKDVKPQKTETVATTAVPARAVTERRQTLGGETVLRAPIHQTQRRVYIVRPGDTLGSIAKREMGDKRKWTALYNANKHLIDDPEKLEKGMRILIP